MEELIATLLQILKTRPQWGLLALRLTFGSVLILQARDLLSQKRRESRLLFLSTENLPVRLIEVVAKFEIVIGALMIIGLFGRVGGLAILIMGLSALGLEIYRSTVLLRHPFERRMRMLLLAIALVFIISGPGRWSLDWLITAKLEEHFPNPYVHAYIHSETEIDGFKWWW